MEDDHASTAPKLPFANDGSFFEQFQRMQANKQASSKETSPEPKPAISEEGNTLTGAAASGRATPDATSGPDKQGGSMDVPPVPLADPTAAEASAAANADDGIKVDFQPAESFQGSRPGFVYTLGEQGLGYYTDVPHEHRLRQHARAQQAAKAKPVVLKGNSSIVKSLGKRPNVGGPSGMPKKSKEGDDSKPAYLKEMAIYNAHACAKADGAGRPLVK